MADHITPEEVAAIERFLRATPMRKIRRPMGSAYSEDSPNYVGYAEPKKWGGQSDRNISPKIRQRQSRDRLEIRDYFDKGLTIKEMAKEMAMTPNGVRKKMKRLGMQIPFASKDDTKEQIEQCVSDGLTQQETADRLGVHIATLKRACKKHGLSFPRRGAPPSFDVARFKRLIEQGVTADEICDRMGLGRTTVYDWTRRVKRGDV